MSEFFVRFIFWFILLVFYALGAWLSKLAGADIDFKLLLPLLCLVFFDYWLRLFSAAMCSVKRLETILDDDKLLLEFQVRYRGANVVTFGIWSVEGLDGVNIELIAVDPQSQEDPESLVPEDLAKSLSQSAPYFAFQLICHFRHAPVPILLIPLIQWRLFRIRVAYRIDNYIRRKRYYILVNRNGKVLR